MDQRFAFISDGRLFTSAEGSDPLPLESPFATQLLTRHQQIRNRNAWKYTGPSGRLTCSGLQFAMEENCLPPVRVIGAGRGENGNLLYCVQSEEIAGFFSQNLSAREELRLAHSTELTLSGIDYSSERKLAVCSVRNRDGSSSIAVVDPRDGRPRTITEGDAIDLNAAWIPGESKSIVYQSCGIGRGPAGEMRMFGPTEICRLNLESGEHSVIASEPKFEFVSPKIDTSGTLYYIRHPYVPVQRRSLQQIAKDTFFFPVRLFHAIVGWLNIFSIVYGGKPIVSQGDTKARIQDPQKAMMNANIFRACHGGSCEISDESSYVAPKSYQLFIKEKDGTPVQLAEGVACFDLCEDGGVLYSDGKTIFRIDKPGERPKVVGKSREVSKVIALH